MENRTVEHMCVPICCVLQKLDNENIYLLLYISICPYIMNILFLLYKYWKINIWKAAAYDLLGVVGL